MTVALQWDISPGICTHIPQAPRKNVFRVASSCRSIRVRYICWLITPISLIYIYRCLYMAAVLASDPLQNSSCCCSYISRNDGGIKNNDAEKKRKREREKKNLREIVIKLVELFDEIWTTTGKIIYTTSSDEYICRFAVVNSEGNEDNLKIMEERKIVRQLLESCRKDDASVFKLIVDSVMSKISQRYNNEMTKIYI